MRYLIRSTTFPTFNWFTLLLKDYRNKGLNLFSNISLTIIFIQDQSYPNPTLLCYNDLPVAIMLGRLICFQLDRLIECGALNSNLESVYSLFRPPFSLFMVFDSKYEIYNL